MATIAPRIMYDRSVGSTACSTRFKTVMKSARPTLRAMLAMASAARSWGTAPPQQVPEGKRDADHDHDRQRRKRAEVQDHSHAGNEGDRDEQREEDVGQHGERSVSDAGEPGHEPADQAPPADRQEAPGPHRPSPPEW